MIDYRLMVLTHGPPDDLRRSLASFAEMVRPFPRDAALLVDGKGDLEHLDLLVSAVGCEASVYDSGGEAGFCAQVARGWELAAASPSPWIVWLEHDFIFNRPVDLAELAAVLEARPELAQMALRRQPVSPEEIAVGGYVELRPHLYEPQSMKGPLPYSSGVAEWLEHDLYWTTNPSLFSREIARAHPWPADQPQCEGLFGFQLREARPGTRFGLWGSREGEPWVTHIGTRSGSGY